jgi:hypothetical protein
VPVITGRSGTHLYAAAITWFREPGAAPSLHHACSSLPTRVRTAALGVKLYPGPRDRAGVYPVEQKERTEFANSILPLMGRVSRRTHAADGTRSGCLRTAHDLVDVQACDIEEPIERRLFGVE